MTDLPDDVVFRAWEEYVYPLTTVERPMTPGFERAVRVINEWLAGPPDLTPPMTTVHLPGDTP